MSNTKVHEHFGGLVPLSPPMYRPDWGDVCDTDITVDEMDDASDYGPWKLIPHFIICRNDAIK
jgi:hypothetical protein